MTKICAFRSYFSADQYISMGDDSNLKIFAYYLKGNYSERKELTSPQIGSEQAV